MNKKLNPPKQKLHKTLLKHFGNGLRRADFLGKEFNFSSKGSDKFQTPIGAVLTLLLFGLTIFLTINISQSFFDTTQPHVQISTRIESLFPIRRFYEEKYPFAVGLVNSNNENIPAAATFQYLTVILEVAELVIDDIESGVVPFDIPKIYFFIPCKDVVDTTLTDDFLKDNPIDSQKQYFEDHMLCPDIDDPKELYALSNPTRPPFRKVDVKVYPCTLSDTSLCKNTPAELSTITVRLASTAKTFRPENKLENIIATNIIYDDIRINPA
jgi:preprotein translocase subunit SecG